MRLELRSCLFTIQTHYLLAIDKFVVIQGKFHLNVPDLDVYVDVVELRAQADASMPISNNNVNLHYML